MKARKNREGFFMTLGERLTALRKGAGLSQEQMAAELNVSRQAISKWETDQSAPELEKLMALAERFAVSTDELLGRKVPQKETQPETAKKPDGADALTRAAFSRRCLTLGWATMAGAAVLLCIELLMLPVLRDRAVELAVKIGTGFYTDAMRYAKAMPMPLVFAVTGALALLGLGLVLYAVSRERDKK